jgi:hypothetical protein
VGEERIGFLGTLGDTPSKNLQLGGNNTKGVKVFFRWRYFKSPVI